MYCTYFDSNYLARGLAMIRSLQSHEPKARVLVLAFDETCARVLEDVLGTAVRVMPVGILHAHDPELAALRGKRSQWAFFATHKAALVKYILEGVEAPDALTFLDADLWFFDDLSAARLEIGEASIALSPHRFSERSRELAMYGTYNAGFIYWRNDPTGRRSAGDWRLECLDWCEEGVETDGRFMNQGYLNRWPERYGGIHIIRNPGVNLAPWNLDNHVIEREGDRVTVDGTPLTCYHFSGVVRTAEGWQSWYPHDMDRFEAAHEAIYAPYVTAVERESRALLREYGISGATSVRAETANLPAIRLRPWPVP